MAGTINFKILYVIGQLRRGGAEQQLYYLLKYLKSSGAVVSMERSNPATYWDDPIRELGYTVHEIDRRRTGDFDRLRSLIHIIRMEKPDFVHLYADTPAGIYGRLACIITRTPCIVGERRHPSADPYWYEQLKAKWLNRHVAAVVANAHSSRDYLVKLQGVPENKAHFIPNGIELDRFQKPLENARALLPADWQDAVVITTVASLLPKKAPEVFLKVAHRVIEQHEQARFLHVGRGPLLESMQILAKQMGIKDRVCFLGERYDVPELLHASDIFLLTSKNEGTPNAVMEAMAVGLPCIATNTGDTASLVKHGNSGIITPVGDVDALANAVSQLITSPDQRRQMGLTGTKIICDYDVRENAERYRQLYAKLYAQFYTS